MTTPGSTCTIGTTACAGSARRVSGSAGRLRRRAPRCRGRGARRGAWSRPRGRSGCRARAARRRRAPPRSPGRRRDAGAGRSLPPSSSTASISSAIAIASAELSERGSTSTRRTWSPLASRSSAPAAVHTPASIPIPCAASTSASSRQPSSLRLSETRSGHSVHAVTARSRASTSPAVIQSPVESETSTPRGPQLAHRGGDVHRFQRLVPVRVTRVRVERRRARRDARPRLRAQLLGRARDAGLAVPVQAGLEDHAFGSADDGEQRPPR